MDIFDFVALPIIRCKLFNFSTEQCYSNFNWTMYLGKAKVMARAPSFLFQGFFKFVVP